VRVIARADCLEWLPTLEAESIDSCVTDPPYGLEFMGKDWDKLSRPKPGNLGGFADGNKPSFERVRKHLPAMQSWHFDWATEVFRVLKPGAHLLAFGGTRTFHRLVCAIEDAGFEIRDTIAWCYGSGFPKSLDVSKAIDKAAGAEREVVGENLNVANRPSKDGHGFRGDQDERLTAPSTPEAIQWDGWGTALKPAMELVCVARKPLSEKTVAANVLRWGTGAINVGGCRIGHTPGDEGAWGTVNRGDSRGDYGRGWKDEDGQTPGSTRNPSGRWPANLVLDEDAARVLDETVGETSRGGKPKDRTRDRSTVSLLGNYRPEYEPYEDTRNGGHGPSRFFYCAKASRKEREAGCEGTEAAYSARENGFSDKISDTKSPRANHHPTVKPLALMRWLCRLVTPPGGIVLDPFAGSGSTLIAAAQEGFRYLGCESDEEYVAIAEARLAHWGKQPMLVGGGLA